jgi:hypothetical protein
MEEFMKRFLAVLLAFGPMVLLIGCGTTSDVTGPGTPNATLLAINPQGGATNVSVSSAIVFRFGAAMGAGMEQFVDLHVGDLAGPVVPMRCGWSADRTMLTCSPQGPLPPQTVCVAHLAGGMVTQAGRPLDYGPPMMGGQWVTGGMMGGSHAGGPWGSMRPGWRNGNGSYGMAFTFTTA